MILDSIQELRKLCKDESIDLDFRFKFALKASELSHKREIDTTILQSNKSLMEIYLVMGEQEIYRGINFKNLKLASKLNDSIEIAHANRNLAWYHQNTQFHVDSAYAYSNKALILYRKLKDIENESLTLSYIADLQKNEHDYLNSNANLVKAINLLKLLPEDDTILDYLIGYYNQIGLNSKNSKLYEEAIEYFNKSLIINNKLPDKYDYNFEGHENINKYFNYLSAKLNLAEVYKEKKNHKRALSIYKELLKDKDLQQKDPLTHLIIINNKAYTLFLSKNKKTNYIKSLFNEAYKISDSLDAYYELVAGGNDMAEFYLAINQKDSARILSKRSYTIGKQIRNNYEVSRALLTLSKIEEGEAGKQYLYEHIRLNDSLLDIERAARNKFARIQYETDNYKNETERLAAQNILIVVIGLILILIFMLVFTIRVQITKNKILRFESERQKANEEIYTLMIRQQAKIEEGRLLERHRISEELHDGILNRLLGTRLSLEFLIMNQQNKTQYSPHIDEIQAIEREIRDLSHELKNIKLDTDKDFITILKDYIESQSNLYNFHYSINRNADINWEDINDLIKVNLYRIIQEAIHNVVKHAKATYITVSFSLDKKHLCLDISDNGMGFNINQDTNGIGLMNIRSRVSKLNGGVSIHSEVKKGTTIVIRIPL